MPAPAESRSLASCHGYQAVADDGSFGEVETPLFPPGSDIPDYLVISVYDRRTTRALVGVGRVMSIDGRLRVIRLRGSIRELARLPSALPLARRL